VPLLRYRTGDAGQVDREACDCGYHGWTITDLRGRRACAFVRTDGSAADAWQLAWVFKHTALNDFRVTQSARDDFEVELVGATDSPQALAELRARLTAALQHMGWHAPRIDIRLVAELATTGGKPEAFRCAVRASC
jgi:phenylacetate-CoA ligase